jgi:hypothetical protein
MMIPKPEVFCFNIFTMFLMITNFFFFCVIRHPSVVFVSRAAKGIGHGDCQVFGGKYEPKHEAWRFSPKPLRRLELDSHQARPYLCPGNKNDRRGTVLDDKSLGRDHI